jgi:hypothetical protein
VQSTGPANGGGDGTDQYCGYLASTATYLSALQVLVIMVADRLDWDLWKEEIATLYRDHTLKEVMEKMASKGFHAR